MKKVSLILSAVAMTAMMLSSYGEGASDREGASDDVTIGQQVWMSENLNVDKFRNGDPIQEAKTDDEWEKAGENGEPAWCYYNNNSDNGERYGKLYNWFAVNDPRGLAPEGWKIPSDDDWTRLTEFIGEESDAGKKIKSTEFWVDKDGESGNGTNESGFSGLPGGNRNTDGAFYSIGSWGCWWSSTENDTNHAYGRHLCCNRADIFNGDYIKAEGMSVRCLRD